MPDSGHRNQTTAKETACDQYLRLRTADASKSNKPYDFQSTVDHQKPSSGYQYNVNESWNGNFSLNQNVASAHHGNTKPDKMPEAVGRQQAFVFSGTTSVSKSKRLSETQRNPQSTASSSRKENYNPKPSEMYNSLGSSKADALSSFPPSDHISFLQPDQLNNTSKNFQFNDSYSSQLMAPAYGNLNMNQKEEKLVYFEEDEGQGSESLQHSSGYDPKFSSGGCLDDFELPRPRSDASSGISENIKKNLRRVAIKYPLGIWAKDFPSMYEDTVKSTFDLHSLGFNDLAAFISAVPNIFVRKPLSGSRKDWLIFPSDDLEENHSRNVKEGSNAGFLLVEYIIDCTRRILQGYPEGVRLSEFLHIYSLNCNEPLHLADLGFNSLENFLTSIADRVPLKLDSRSGYKYVFYVQLETPFVEEEKESLPSDAASPSTEYASLKLEVDNTKYLAVYTSTIRNPGHLYIQLQGPEMTKMLSMYDDMEAFYHSNQGDAYRMKSSHIKRGIMCVALWPNDRHWYRAKVLSMKSADTVRVFYVDYGTIQDIPNTLLRYIKKDYVNLPMQALKSSLAHLRPSNNAAEWSPKARERMLQMCQELSLMALIEAIDDDGVLSITLCDTNGENDVYINDVLMHEGLAESIAVGEIPPPSMETYSPLQLLQAQYMVTAYSALTAGTMSPEVVAKMTQNLAINMQNLGLSQSNLDINSLSPPIAGANSLMAPLVDISPPRPVIPPPKQNQFTVPNYSMLPKPPGLELPSYSVPAPFVNPIGSHPSSVQAPMTQGYTQNNLFGTEQLAVGQEFSNESPEDSDIFEDDDDAFFEEFYQKVSNVSKRYVKRVLTGDHYTFHILIVESEAYVSNGDVSALIWNKEPDYLLQRLQHRGMVLQSKTLTEENNEQMFNQFRRFHVKGIEDVENRTTLLVYPLRSMIQILNEFGHPSANLRSKIVYETEAFDPHNPIWQELSEIEIPEDEEEFTGVTDDDKLNRLCLYDLKAMKEGIRIRRLKNMNRLGVEGNVSPVVDEKDKLDQLYNKVIERIRQIEQICTMFT